MKNIRRFCYLLLLIIIPLSLSAEGENEGVKFGHEGPFVLYPKGGGVRVLSSNGEGVIFDTTYTKLTRDFSVDVTTTDGASRFNVSMHPHYKQAWRQKQAEQTLVISDLHGNKDATMALLLSNGVMNSDYNWSFGTNHLIVIGDVADRGRDDTAIYWLLYKLEKQAKKSKGRVSFLYGNHDDMILRGDLRYVNKVHLSFTEETGIEWDKLWGKESELGRWMRGSNAIMVVGDNLFVHAGLSRELTDEGYTVKEINKLIDKYVGIPSKERDTLHKRNKFLFSSLGPLWYRGLVFDSEKHPAIKSEDLDVVLTYFGVSRIFVGHSEVDEVESRYDGRVIAVNTPHYKNFPRNGTGGVLIIGNKLYSVSYTGERVALEN